MIPLRVATKSSMTSTEGSAAKASQRPVLPKRFYSNAELLVEGDLFVVVLDGRFAKTPGRARLGVSNRVVGEALAAEWEAQAEVIDPATMPLTRIINSSIDGVSQRMDEARSDIAAYAGNDLVCYRAEGPDGLVARQTSAWDPMLSWFFDEFGVRLQVGTGVLPLTQPAEAPGRILDMLRPFDALPLTAAHVVTTLTGSAVLALAVAFGRLSPEAVWSAAHVDEDWQVDQWGAVAEAKVQRESRWRDMGAAALVLGTRDA